MKCSLEIMRLRKMSQDLDLPENLKNGPMSFSLMDIHDLAIS